MSPNASFFANPPNAWGGRNLTVPARCRMAHRHDFAAEFTNRCSIRLAADIAKGD
jgi:hypothetical protein